MKIEQKSQIVDELVKDLAEYPHIYVTDTSGFTVDVVNQLRRTCYRKDIKLKVVKNTLLKRAMEQSETDYSEVYPALAGPTAVMFTTTGNAPARLIKEFRQKNKKPLIKAAFIEEATYFGDDQLENLCNIKSREELIGDLVGLLQSPAKNVISALQSGGGKLAGIVKTLSEK
ncbi:50S ribosomal protein L10 [Bacteroidales bacterium OttesenSCG-928-E04]|nr:50S ribosomal protein L10 [Bacteroidales bacterium OttesenSCG-928-E04]MDL2325707.1 50S ribosomal protein L10 [Bacteroidales bacterium OttesenSCG-928-A14]